MDEKIIAVTNVGGSNEIHLAWAIPASRLDEFLSQVDALAQECGGDPLEEVDLSNPSR